MIILRRVLLAALASFLVLAAAGALYQTLSVRSETRRFPPPGRLVNVAREGEPERRLHLICVGEGEPTVIFEPSGFSGALSFAEARTEVSARTRVCSYDRMGMGWSDPGPGEIPVGLLAEDLERLTVQASLRPPFILAPSSIGGLVAELFARRYPNQVAGLVFVDAANSVIHERFLADITRTQVAAACLAKTAAQLGVLRLLDPFRLRQDASEAAAQSISRIYRAEPMTTLCGIARGFKITAQQFAAAPPLAPEIPLVVLIHEKPYGLLPPGLDTQARMVEPEWLGLQQRFAQSSPRGTWRVVPGSIHPIASSQPHAVAAAILDLVAEVRHPR